MSGGEATAHLRRSPDDDVGHQTLGAAPLDDPLDELGEDPGGAAGEDDEPCETGPTREQGEAAGDEDGERGCPPASPERGSGLRASGSPFMTTKARRSKPETCWFELHSAVTYRARDPKTTCRA